MGARYAEEIIRNMEQHIRANKPQLAIRVSVEYDNLWKLPNVLYDFGKITVFIYGIMMMEL